MEDEEKENLKLHSAIGLIKTIAITHRMRSNAPTSSIINIYLFSFSFLCLFSSRQKFKASFIESKKRSLCLHLSDRSQATHNTTRNFAYNENNNNDADDTMFCCVRYWNRLKRKMKYSVESFHTYTAGLWYFIFLHLLT